MEQEEKQNPEKIYKSGARLFVIIALLLLLIFLFGSLSTGWFARNTNVTATGMSTRIEGLHLGPVKVTEVTYTRFSTAKNQDVTTKLAPPDWTKTDVLLPGDKITVTAEFTTLDNGGKTVPVALFVRTPQDTAERKADVPVVAADQTAATKNQLAYFLSSQIRVDSMTLTNITQGKPGTEVVSKNAINQMLSTYAWGVKTPVTQKLDEISLGKAEGNKALPEKGTFRLVLKMTFVNADFNQVILRGNPEDQTVVPSSFWREIAIQELPQPTNAGK